MRELVFDYCEYLIGQVREINNKENININDAIKRDVLIDVIEELTDICYK